jgi:hypothetical protein
MKMILLTILVAALASLSSGCASYALYGPTETDTARDTEHAVSTEAERLLYLAECERQIQKNALSLGGADFVIG